MAAAIPSVDSSEPVRDSCSRRLAIRNACGGFLAMRSASSWAAGSRSSCGHHASDQAPIQCGRRVDAVAGEGHLGGALVADDALQKPRAAVAGDQAELNEAFRERCTLGGDSDVAHQCQVAAGADGGPVDRTDQRNFEPGQRSRDPLDAVNVGMPLIECAKREHAGLVRHLFDVAAGGEDLAHAGEDHRADLGVGVGVVDGRLNAAMRSLPVIAFPTPGRLIVQVRMAPSVAMTSGSTESLMQATLRTRVQSTDARVNRSPDCMNRT